METGSLAVTCDGWMDGLNLSCDATKIIVLKCYETYTILLATTKLLLEYFSIFIWDGKHASQMQGLFY